MSVQKHLVEAQSNIIEVIKNIQEKLNRGILLSGEDVQILDTISKLVVQIRDLWIVACRKSGQPNRKVAELFELTPARISQIVHSFDRVKERERYDNND